jgi:hypothetical protein
VWLLRLALLTWGGATETGEIVVFISCLVVNEEKHGKKYLKHVSRLIQELNLRIDGASNRHDIVASLKQVIIIIIINLKIISLRLSTAP